MHGHGFALELAIKIEFELRATRQPQWWQVTRNMVSSKYQVTDGRDLKARPNKLSELPTNSKSTYTSSHGYFARYTVLEKMNEYSADRGEHYSQKKRR